MYRVEGRADRVYPSTDLRDLMLGVYRDWSEGDDSFVDRVTSDRPEALLIGSDPREWLEGGSAIKAVWRRRLEDTEDVRVHITRCAICADVAAIASLWADIDNAPVSEEVRIALFERASTEPFALTT